MVSWSSADGRVVAGAPAERRRFLDQGVVGTRPGAIAVLGRYRRALDQKRELLRRRQTGRDTGLEAWNQVLAETGSELARRRARYVEELRRAVAELLAENDLDAPEITIDYRPSPAGVSPGSTEDLVRALASQREAELEAGRVLVGPHRDELELGWAGREARRVGSAGEKKLLGLILSAARGRVLDRYRRDPVYLLDDFDSELDADRLAAAFSLFAGQRQVFLTSANPGVWERLGGVETWGMSGGRVGAEKASKNAV